MPWESASTHCRTGESDRMRSTSRGGSVLSSLGMHARLGTMHARLSGAVLLLLLGVAVWLMVGRGDPPSVPREPAVSTAPDSGDTASGRLASGREVGKQDPERTAVLDQTANNWVVRGELMHGSVAPLPGAQFEARVFAGAEAVGTPLRQATLISDGDGGFAWALPAPGGTVTLSFAQCRVDTAIMADPRTVLMGDGPPQDLTIFAFLKDCEVSGTVTDAAHQPIAGSWVKGSSRDEPQACNAAGEYQVLTMATYGDTTITAGAPGHALARQTVKVKGPNARVAMDFELKPAVRLAGRITDTNDAPVAGALVYTFETRAVAARTDADGHYEIPYLDPSRDRHTVQSEHDDYLTAQRSLTRQQVDAACDLVMQRGARVTGRVFGAGGGPVAGAEVHLGQWIGYLGSPRAVSHADGTFDARNVPAGQGQLSIFARGYAPHQRPVSVPAGETASLDLEVHLEAGHFVAGRVVDVDGKGLHRVRITPLAVQRQHGQVGDETYTARDGSFRLTDLPAGKIDIDCFGTHLARKEELGIDVDRADVRIVMQRPARLAGRVVDDATGHPMARFSIRFVNPELHGGEQRGGGYGVEWSTGLVFEDTDGYWNTDNEHLDAGTVFGVEATAEGYGPAIARRAIPGVDANPDALVLRLRPAARITGRAVDQRSGAGIEGAQLAVFSPDHPLDGSDPFEDARQACRTDAQGAFEIAGVPAGPVSLVFRHPDWPPTFDGPFDAVAGATTTRIVTVRAGATLTGTALDLQGNPLAGVNVAREAVEIAGLKVPHAAVTTDASGRFRFPALPTASYRLHASGRLADGSTIIYSRDVDVTSDEDLDLRLEPAGSGAIQAELTGEETLPEALSVQIWRTDASSRERPFSAPVSGPTFVVRGLPVGEFNVSVAHIGTTAMVTGRASVSVTAGTTARVRIPMTTRQR